MSTQAISTPAVQPGNPAAAEAMRVFVKETGAWPPSRTSNEPGQTYATAMSVLTLSVPLQLLPTYQR